jgi:two-component system, cell cycle response regulator
LSDSKKKTKRSDETVIFNETTEKTDLSEKANTSEPYLIQISGRDTGMMFNLTGRTVKIGRDPTCEVSVDDPHVSRFHAEITHPNESDIVIKDMGSTNGVFVNGQRLEHPHALVDGDKILVGTRLYFRFTYQDAVDQTYQQNLFRAANIDGLTQLYNKKYFQDVLSKEFSFSRRAKQDLSLLMFDVDHFKKVNDTYGHVAGDAVLKMVGFNLTKQVRMENIACRYGGEEFAVILRNVSPEQAYSLGERLRSAIEGSSVEHRGNHIKVTVSVGVATFRNDNFQTYEDLLQRADECLYEAKRNGRNQTVITLKKAA